jgi:hypothetical protein
MTARRPFVHLPSSYIRSPYSMIVPIYQSEISPANHRGKLACIEFTGNIIGYASSIWIDYACSFITSDLSWRVPLGIQCLGGAVLAAGTWVTPESPRCVWLSYFLTSAYNPSASLLASLRLYVPIPDRYLIDKDRDDEGLRVIADFGSGGNMDDPLAKAEFTEIKEAILADVSSCIPTSLSSSPRLRKVTLPDPPHSLSNRGYPLIRLFAACRRGSILQSSVQAVSRACVYRHEQSGLCANGTSD